MKSIREIYKIGKGPSSSHTMGPQKAAAIFRKENPDAASYKAILYGSLAETGKGHLTDTAILETFEQTRQVMTELAEDGYRFYLDDFGAGYSNFNCLFQLPFRLIKLDACLVRGRQAQQNNYATARTLTALFHQMGFLVIAEGAETLEEVEMLRSHGIDRVQGYALARPMPEDKLLEFYAAQN